MSEQNLWGTLLTGLGTAAINNYYNKQLMREQNKFNAEQAQLQRDYETEMSNTAYQRAYEDMKKAGINPNLAGGAGGASTPAGSAATSAGVAPFDLAGAMNASANAAMTQAQIENMNADTNLKQKQSGKTREEMKMIEFDRKFKEETRHIEITMANYKLTKKEYDQMINDATSRILESEAGITGASEKTAVRNRRWHEIRDSITSFIPFASPIAGNMTRKSSGGITINNAK